MGQQDHPSTEPPGEAAIIIDLQAHREQRALSDRIDDDADAALTYLLGRADEWATSPTDRAAARRLAGDVKKRLTAER